MNQSEVQSLFDYNPSTGQLIRKSNNKVVGIGLNGLGYPIVKVKNKVYNCHRLIYIWNKGDIPKDYHIDHIDHDRTNNRIENLRAIPASINLAKQKRCNYYGIKKTKNNLKYIARVTIELGEYDTEEDARDAIEEYKRTNNSNMKFLVKKEQYNMLKNND